MQNTTIKLEKRTVLRKTKKNNTAIKAVLILTVLCCLFSTIAQATEMNINGNNVTRYVLFNYETLDAETLTNHAITGYVINNGQGYNTNYRTTYSTILGKMYLTFNKTKINNIQIEVKAHSELDDGTVTIPILANYQTYTVGTRSLNPYAPSIRFKRAGVNSFITYNISQNEVDNSANKVNKIFSDGATIKMYRESYIHYNAKFNSLGNEEFEQIELSLPFVYISSVLIYDEINITINNEVYQIVNELENTINQIESGQDEAINAINPNGIDGVMSDLQNNLDNTFTEIQKYNNNTLNAIFYANILSGSAVIQIVMMISMTLTIISYIIFGKYK